MFNSNDKNYLEKKRTILASVRTFLSYLRTSLTCVSVSVAFIKFDKNDPINVFTISLLVLAGVSLVAGIITLIETKKSTENS